MARWLDAGSRPIDPDRIMTATDWRRWLGGAAVVVLLALLVADVGTLATTAIGAIRYPYDLDYGEGIVWQQMTNIAVGTGYAPLGVFPAIVYHYPPVYHLVVATAVAVGADPLVAGRTISALSTLVAMILIGWLSAAVAGASNRRVGMIGGVVAGLAFGTAPTVVAWAPLMRVDMLATALTLAGLCATVREMRVPARFPAAAILFALAVYTKQTAIIAPLAAFATLWVVDRSAAWRFIMTCGSLGAAALVMLTIQTDGQFLRHVLNYNINRFDPDRWYLLVSTLASQTITLALATAVVVGMCGRLVETPARLLVVFYLVLRVATLPLALKSGASDNYLIDLFSAAAILAGAGAAQVAAAVLADGRWPRAIVTGLVLVGLPIQAARLGEQHPVIHDAGRRALNDSLARRIAAADRPVISDNMVLLRRGGQPVLYEPAIAAELAHSGLYDEAGFRAMIRRGAFAFFITEDPPGTTIHTERYNPRVRAAIAAAYPRVERYGETMIHLPAAGAPVIPAGPAGSRHPSASPPPRRAP